MRDLPCSALRPVPCFLATNSPLMEQGTPGHAQLLKMTKDLPSRFSVQHREHLLLVLLFLCYFALRSSLLEDENSISSLQSLLKLPRTLDLR